MAVFLYSACQENDVNLTFFQDKKLDTNDSTILLTDEEYKILKYLDDDFTFRLDEAKKHALDIAKSFTEADGIVRTIQEIKTANLPLHHKIGHIEKTDSIPELYILNFKPKGFAIISADERSLGHIASNLSLAFDDSIHIGYQIVYEGALAKIFRDREDFARVRDSVLKTETYLSLSKKLSETHPKEKQPLVRNENWVDKIFNFFSLPAYAQWGGSSTSSYVTEVFIGYENFYNSGSASGSQKDSVVLLATCFSQRFPYNMKMDYCYSPPERYLAGCVAVAHAQVMLYYGTPQIRSRVLGSHRNADFDGLRNAHYPKKDGATNLFVTANDFDNGNVYTSRQYEALAGLVVYAYDEWMNISPFPFDQKSLYRDCGLFYTGTAVPWLRSVAIDHVIDGIFNEKHGFHPARWQNYDDNTVKNSIRNQKPVLMYGERGSSTKAHEWVVDGYKNTTTTYTGAGTYTYAVYEIRFGGRPSSIKSYKLVSESSYSYTTITNNEIHHNWGWGDASSMSKYQAQNWTASGVFISPIYVYTDQIRCLPNITPR